MLCLLFIVTYCIIQYMTISILYRGIKFYVDGGGKASRNEFTLTAFILYSYRNFHCFHARYMNLSVNPSIILALILVC